MSRMARLALRARLDFDSDASPELCGPKLTQPVAVGVADLVQEKERGGGGGKASGRRLEEVDGKSGMSNFKTFRKVLHSVTHCGVWCVYC